MERPEARKRVEEMTKLGNNTTRVPDHKHRGIPNPRGAKGPRPDSHIPNIPGMSPRSYSPGMACWLTKVRLEEQLAGEHPYSYCQNNPTTYIDPLGLQVKKQPSSSPPWFDIPGWNTPHPPKPHHVSYIGPSGKLAGFQYGAYCGATNVKNTGWAVLPQDCLDSCCQTHDRCLEAHFGAWYTDHDAHVCCDDTLHSCADWALNSGCCRRTSIDPKQCEWAAVRVMQGMSAMGKYYYGRPTKPCLMTTDYPKYVRLHWGDPNSSTPQGPGLPSVPKQAPVCKVK